jgi:thiamine-phosphate pyrophosphorylase
MLSMQKEWASSGAQSLLGMPSRGVYAITPLELVGATLLQAVGDVIKGGAVMLQYRAKPPTLPDALAIKQLCDQAGVVMIINDDIDLAQRLGCGVHLGESDESIQSARATLGQNAVIGASCYDSVVLAQRAADAGASYVAFGAFFPSSSKDQPRRASTKLLQKARAIGLPTVAIGGIDATNASPIIEAGADFIAVISSIFSSPDVNRATSTLAALFKAPIHA